MATIGKYPQTWKLNLSTTETVSAVFHLNNKEAKCELISTQPTKPCPFALSSNTVK